MPVCFFFFFLFWASHDVVAVPHRQQTQMRRKCVFGSCLSVYSTDRCVDLGLGRGASCAVREDGHAKAFVLCERRKLIDGRQTNGEPVWPLCPIMSRHVVK